MDGGYWIINFGTLMVLLGCITTRFIDEDNYAEPSEKEANLKAPSGGPCSFSGKCGRNPPSASSSSSWC